MEVTAHRITWEIDIYIGMSVRVPYYIIYSGVMNKERAVRWEVKPITWKGINTGARGVRGVIYSGVTN